MKDSNIPKSSSNVPSVSSTQHTNNHTYAEVWPTTPYQEVPHDPYCTMLSYYALKKTFGNNIVEVFGITTSGGGTFIYCRTICDQKTDNAHPDGYMLDMLFGEHNEEDTQQYDESEVTSSSQGDRYAEYAEHPVLKDIEDLLIDI